MIKTSLVCTICHKKEGVVRTDIITSNGAFVYLDRRGRRRRPKRCYQCERLNVNSKWLERKHTYYKYEKTISGYLMRKYRNMKSRIEGVQKNKWHLCRGLTILSKADFYIWATSNDEFQRLFKIYKKSNHRQKIAPSINRINPKYGYEIWNMEWITHSENSRLGAVSRRGVSAAVGLVCD